MENEQSRLAKTLSSAWTWIDTSVSSEASASSARDGGPRVDWIRVVPFLFLHLGCVAILWVGWSATAVTCAIGLYLLRAFFVTAFYHRYFSHRTYKTSRAAQFLFAILGNAALQRGALWWASHHRQHHRNADQESDPHSPHRHGLYWWEIDLTYMVLRVMAWTGLIWDLNPVPAKVLAAGSSERRLTKT